MHTCMYLRIHPSLIANVHIHNAEAYMETSYKTSEEVSWVFWIPQAKFISHHILVLECIDNLVMRQVGAWGLLWMWGSQAGWLG